MSLYDSLKRQDNKITTIVGSAGTGKTTMVLSIIDQLFPRDLKIDRLIGDGSYFLITSDRSIIREGNKLDPTKVLFVSELLDHKILLGEIEKVLRYYRDLSYLIIDTGFNFTTKDSLFFDSIVRIFDSTNTSLIITKNSARHSSNSPLGMGGSVLAQYSDLIIEMNSSYGAIVKWRNYKIGDLIFKDGSGKRYKLD